MPYPDLIRLYFERSDALQSYWMLYVVVIGGLLAFSSIRTRPGAITTLLVSILFSLFAYKNLAAIHETTNQRLIVLQGIQDKAPMFRTVPSMDKDLIATMTPPAYDGVRRFHVSCDLLTIAAIWAMELRRRRITRKEVAG